MYEGLDANKPNFEFKEDLWALPTDIDLLESAATALEERLQMVGWSEEEIYDIQLGFREALINAIAHGNLGLTKPEGGDLCQMARIEISKHPEKRNSKHVYVTIEISKDKVVIHIRDEGNGFKREEVPDPTSEEGLFKEKGRGILIMENYFDSAVHNKEGNEVTMTKVRKG
ncbi:MAG: ATP-binding protein [Candidatus Paceibacterota bacterium]